MSTNDYVVALNRIIAGASRATELDEALPELLAATLETTGFDGGAIYTNDQARRVATVACQKGVDAGWLAIVKEMPLAGPPADVLVAGEPLFISEASEHDVTKHLEGYPYASLAAVPLIVGSEVIGSLNMASYESHDFDPGEQSLLTAVGHEAGQLVSRIRALTAVRDERKRLRDMLDAMADGVYIVDEDCRLEFVNRGVREILGDPGDLSCHAYFHESDEPCPWCARERVFAGETVSRQVTLPRTGRVYDVYDAPLPGPDASISKIAFIHDVTELVEAREGQRLAAERLTSTLEGTMAAMGAAIELRDPYTAGHQRRVTQLAVAIAAEMSLGGAIADAIRYAGYLHDVGQLAVPAAILVKPARLSEVEFNIVKTHVAAGRRILERVGFSLPLADIVAQHHERLDGSGYPEGLEAGDIRLEARVLAVADVVEAMSSHRPWRPALGTEAALEEVRGGAGTLYDAAIVEACERVFAAGFGFDG